MLPDSVFCLTLAESANPLRATGFVKQPAVCYDYYREAACSQLGWINAMPCMAA